MGFSFSNRETAGAPPSLQVPHLRERSEIRWGSLFPISKRIQQLWSSARHLCFRKVCLWKRNAKKDRNRRAILRSSFIAQCLRVRRRIRAAEHNRFPTTQMPSNYSFNLAGSDTSGGRYTGSLQRILDGPTTVDGRNVTQIRTILIINGSSTQNTTYYNADGSIYKSVHSNGVIEVETNTSLIPATVRVGDSGGGSTFAGSDGTTHTSIWQVVDAGGGTAKLVVSWAINGSPSEQDGYILDPAGNLVGISFVFYYANGVTITLSTT